MTLKNTTSYKDITRAKANEVKAPEQQASDWKFYAPFIGAVVAAIGGLWYLFRPRNANHDRPSLARRGSGPGGGPDDGDSGGDGGSGGGGRGGRRPDKRSDDDQDVRDQKFKIIQAELQRRIDVSGKKLLIAIKMLMIIMKEMATLVEQASVAKL